MSEAHDDRGDEACDYEVGYGRPPKATQFKKGVSGNPSGRPRNRLNTARAFADALSHEVEVRTATGVQRKTLEEVIALNAAKQAATEKKPLNARFLFDQAERLGLTKVAAPPPALTPEEEDLLTRMVRSMRADLDDE